MSDLTVIEHSLSHHGMGSVIITNSIKLFKNLMKTFNPKHALLPTTPDPRDFSRHKIFGSIALANLSTEDFLVEPPLEIMNQDINYPSDFCSAYALTAVSEDQDGLEEVPEYTFAKAKQVLIQNQGITDDAHKLLIIQAFGLQLRDICNGGVKYGFLEREHDPFACNTVDRPPRDFLADYRNWPAELDALAWEHAKNSYVSCDGPYDTFDNFRTALFANRANRQSIITGALWRRSWSTAPGGVISDATYNVNETGSGHAFKICGQATTEAGLCLVAQLSDGVDFGDHGLFYFTRSVVNREFGPYGGFHFSNVPKAAAQISNDYNFTLNATAWQKFWAIASYVINTYIKPK